MRIPISITTDKDKLKFLYRAVELLRLEHNEKGKDFREGRMPEKDFRDYQKYDFEPRNQKLFFEINNILEAEGVTKKESILAEPTAKQIEFEQLIETGKTETKWDESINLEEI